MPDSHPTRHCCWMISFCHCWLTLVVPVACHYLCLPFTLLLPFVMMVRASSRLWWQQQATTMRLYSFDEDNKMMRSTSRGNDKGSNDNKGFFTTATMKAAETTMSVYSRQWDGLLLRWCQWWGGQWWAGNNYGIREERDQLKGWEGKKKRRERAEEKIMIRVFLKLYFISFIRFR